MLVVAAIIFILFGFLFSPLRTSRFRPRECFCLWYLLICFLIKKAVTLPNHAFAIFLRNAEDVVPYNVR